MAADDEHDLQRALLMSMQQPPPEPKRSKPPRTAPAHVLAPVDADGQPPDDGDDDDDGGGGGGGKEEHAGSAAAASSSSVAAAAAHADKNPDDDDDDAGMRRKQRELRAAAAEQRMLRALQKASPLLPNPNPNPNPNPTLTSTTPAPAPAPASATRDQKEMEGKALSLSEAERLFSIVFDPHVPTDVITQWCHQGFRFSADQETSLGLVQREGGPCGVLAPVQAVLLKYLLFEHNGVPDSIANREDNRLPGMRETTLVFSHTQRTRALVYAMAEILWRIGGRNKSILAVLDIFNSLSKDVTKEGEQDEILAQKLEGVSLHSGVDLQRHLRICTLSSMSSLLLQLTSLLPMFRSRVGALLFLFSALLSRGLDAVQHDRDDPGQPLVTIPFGHASQEIVNLLISGQAVPNVFDGHMDIGGGMQLKGIPSNVEVGFLTLLEALNLCKVGQYLKRPKWPIWVVGSESHYTVLFALDGVIQDENELEDRERRIRQAFDAHDQSGGGGFIGAEAVQQLVHDLNIVMPQDMLENLCSSDFVVWNELWQALHQIEKSKGGLKDVDAVRGTKQFELYHFNGIAKTVGNSSAGEVIVQRPRLTRLWVTVPPKWTREEFMMDVDKEKADKEQQPAQHAPLVDCIKTRWQRATCNWSGDSPSIV